ncbi:DUF5615 family PIN-like protein [Fervidibacter sacchari]|uniref:Nuclease of putative toxin-antitoxin system n=1 Tax=Candidatus Fervidibacter sacchari TaxID=1448929 RepID=A0ABT2ENE9_9BACT|nr:DUF5615 family PIN-like protein [Candidatus Fervidibacter sacchari]MCS3919475.1 putative nuclease of putative toxin-antitoxin system [Candidatus Fervidibacter sacchari]WKU15202.1 DUF5615 family PIN-like protein [Candidatus Fervidibacter sacchari]
MSVGLYMNVHIRRQITEGLRQREVDVLTAQEDGATRLSDSELLDRATELRRVLVTEDRDLLREAARRQKTHDCPSVSALRNWNFWRKSENPKTSPIKSFSCR